MRILMIMPALVCISTIGLFSASAQSLNSASPKDNDTTLIYDDGELIGGDAEKKPEAVVKPDAGKPVEKQEERIGREDEQGDKPPEAVAKEKEERRSEPEEPPTMIIQGSGIGMNIGLRYMLRSDATSFINAVQDTMRALIVRRYGSNVEVVDTSEDVNEVVGITFRLKGIVHPFDYLCLEPALTYITAGRLLANKIDDRVEDSSYLEMSDLAFDLNVWATHSPYKRVCFKVGAGVSLGQTTIATSGTMGDVTLEGFGVGVNLLAGLNITFARATVNIDFVVPLASRNIERKSGALTADYQNIELPTKVGLSGIEIRPGVTIHFRKAAREIREPRADKMRM